MDTTYIVAFQDGSKRLHSDNELDLSIYMKGGPVTIYSKEDFIAQFGQAEYDNEFGTGEEKKPSSSLMDRMASAGEPEPVKKEEEQPDSYQDNVIKAIKQLREAGDEVFTQALNLAMKGELNDFDEAFDEGDVLRFNQEDLENLNDPNVLKLMGLLNNIGETMESLRNMNGLGENDWDF